MSTALEERRTDHDVTVRVVTDGSTGRGRRSWLAGIVALVVVGAVLAGVVLLAGVVTGLLDLGNPFATTTVDRTPPALLKELGNLSSYRAARGTFQSTLDIEDDVAFLPSFIAGQRTIFLAQGSVDATVDFSSLPDHAVQRSGDHAVTITLPRPRLGPAEIDPHASHVVSRDRGVVNRIADVFSQNPGGEQRFYELAQKKLHKAAEASALVHRAERNTTAMLKSFLAKLGYTDVKLVYSTAGA